MKLSSLISTSLFLLLFVISCKDEPKSSDTVIETPTKKPTGGDISKFESLDHDFSITPEGSKLFVKGFFNKNLANAAITVNKGNLHIKDGMVSKGEFNLDIHSLVLVANRDESLENFMKGSDAFNSAKYATGSILITACEKTINDQQATHLLKGTINLHGKTISFNVRVRIDYSPKYISINSDQIIIKASDLGIKAADPSQENIYFSLTINGNIIS